VVYVTHDAFTARHTERIIHLADGQVKSEEIVAQPLIAGTVNRESIDSRKEADAKRKEAIQ
jgi:ABC-type lipoprotein export system ATPase subunit